MTEANSSFISLVSVVGSPENKDFFWDTLAPCDQAAFRLCCREARDLANDLVDTLLLQLPCFEYQNHDIRSLPTAEQLAALHTGALRHAGALRVSYKHPDQGPIRLGRAALYMGQYLAAAVALPSVRMCKVSLNPAVVLHAAACVIRFERHVACTHVRGALSGALYTGMR